jgi:hexosaminidase
VGLRDVGPERVPGNQKLTDQGRNRGSLIHVRCDNPSAETETKIAAGIWDPLRMLVQQLWGSPKLVLTWSAFHRGHHRDRATTRRGRPRPPARSRVLRDRQRLRHTLVQRVHRPRVDPGRPRFADQARPRELTWETAYGKGYQTSADGSAWSTLFATTTGDGGTDDTTLSGAGRYVRVQGSWAADPAVEHRDRQPAAGFQRNVTYWLTTVTVKP